jgi:hypothetical protein
MIKRWVILQTLLLAGIVASAQQHPADTTLRPTQDKDLLLDTTLNYDELFQDFDAFMDSILSPHSYFLFSISANRGFYNFESKDGLDITTSRKLTYSPTLGYYHKSGFGITANGYVVDDGSKLNFYQAALTPSFDYLQKKSFATGLSYSRYFTKDSLSFYTTPLQNELYAYFVYRKWWVRPMIAVSYGWGSRNDFEQREVLVLDLRMRRRGFTYINTRETISDFSVMGSLRHDFYWLDVLTYKDHIRFTPQITFTSGTQKFGFNQSSATYATSIRTSSDVLYNSDDVSLDDHLKFQPLSLTAYLRGEYAIGKFFVQPQLAIDYYFPSTSRHFNTLFSLTAGVMF